MRNSTINNINLDTKSTTGIIIRILTVLLLLFIFLIGVKTLGSSFKLFGGAFGKGLIKAVDGPIAGLFTGMLATVMVQSSSVTTSIIVGLVASNVLPLHGAIPMIMGANLGTSVTNTLVSLGHIREKEHFQRAFAAATVHDFFNILSVLVFLPLEILTGVLEKSSLWLAGILSSQASSSIKYSNPLKTAIKPFAKGIEHFYTEFVGLGSQLAGTMMAITSFLLILLSLTFIVKIMKAFVESNQGEIIERLLSKNQLLTVIFGMILTFSVQSSSITTSLLVPMAGAGLISLPSIFPVTVGANLGTTTTALLASLAGGPAGLAIALVHFLFNLGGTLVWFVHPTLRKLPLRLCEALARLTVINRLVGPLYILIAFFLLPILMTFII